ncbi:response regulator [Hymenobacter psychrophilus]|uniref:cAMP-binding domain of CRP or a regulatory subunit of cAMP-dependent protein kinases n=1 Tax=Hymenobacter psychrophilus TaxID=651662 RepID=A0A1H3MXL3_9BACT|nr:response regulator [Hymenobacter psychrophilus]SDY81401.1 cAMP-binding domain of CRP or a regulatory subunit of cAMP-dependent protein kinases [Hymenobacter psychrophilus]
MPPTILLIDDHAPIRENTAELLQLAGYAVLTAENGQLGVALALETRPDLVVCDIMMPVLDGYGVLQIFNQHPQLSGVPFIFLTAKTERADLRRGMELGADDYLTKPFNKAELLSAIGSRLARFQHLRPDYDLQAGGWAEFLADARVVGQLDELTAQQKVHALRKKQDIFHAGDEALRAYLVRSGRVKTVHSTAAGKELITEFYGPGEFFGYLPLLDGTPHSDTAVTVEETELVYLPKADFLALLLAHPEVSQQFIRLLAGRVRTRELQLLGMAFDSLRRRVATALLLLHARADATPAAGITISREDLAALVGTPPESLSRTLNEFRQEGLVELTPGNVRLLHPDKFRRVT